MNTYKIENITNLLDKRNVYYNTNVEIKFVVDMIYKTVSLKPGKSLYMNIEKLPLSIHQLRINGLINVIRMNDLDSTLETEEEKKGEPSYKKRVLKKKNQPKKSQKKQTYKAKTKSDDETNNKSEVILEEKQTSEQTEEKK